MPKNYFEDRPAFSHYPNCISVGDQVMIVTKEKQGTRSMEDLLTGLVVRVLSKGKYYRNGVKVEILVISPEWSPRRIQLYQTVLKDELFPTQLPFVCSGETAIGRIQYILS